MRTIRTAQEARIVQRQSENAYHRNLHRDYLDDIYTRIYERSSAGADTLVYYLPIGSKSARDKDYITEDAMEFLRKNGFGVVYEGMNYGTAKLFITWRDDPSERLYR